MLKLRKYSISRPSRPITVLVDKRDLASYDTYGYGTYILDDGEYYLTVATDAHNAVNNTPVSQEAPAAGASWPRLWTGRQEMEQDNA